MMKKLFENKEFQLDEIIFEDRNKKYGAYVLRRDADAILTRSLFYGLGFFALAAAFPLIANAFKKTPVIVQAPESGSFDFQNVETPEVQVVTPPAVVTPPKKLETFNSVVPEPKREPKAEKPAAKIDQYDHAVAGTQDIKGEDKTSAYTPSADAGPAAQVPVAPPPVKTVNPDAVVANVDVEAAFSGGINAFRDKVQGNFDAASFEGTGEILKTTVTFIVERNGSISNIKAIGPDAAFNREAERTIKNIKGKWNPAKLQGQNVRSFFRFPISMQFE